MRKASYKIRETKNMRHFTYSGNLEDAIEKAIVTLKNYYVDDLELNEGEVSGIY